MSSIVSALDKHTPQQFGENANVEYGWSNKVDENIVQFFFQMVRSSDHTNVERELFNLLNLIKGNEQGYHKQLILLFKIIGQTRDIVKGKGEYSLTYMQIYIWYQFYPKMVLDFLPYMYDCRWTNMGHQYGSWKDFKYFCEYVKNRSGDHAHPLILTSCELATKQLDEDWAAYKRYTTPQEGGYTEDNLVEPELTLIGKWLPREKSKFSWLHAKLAYEMHPEYLKSAEIKKDKNIMLKAKIKCKKELTKILVTLNKVLDTTQVKQCRKAYSEIDYNKVTSITMSKQRLAFQNISKRNEQRSADPDRVQGAKNFNEHVKNAMEKKGSAKINGKRCNVYELVRDALNVRTQLDIDTINLQWEDNGKNNVNGLGNIIPMVDTSGSMESDNCIPLFNAIGLGLRVSEKTHPAFRNRIMTFDANPTWVQLTDTMTFVDKVKHVKNAGWGMNTDFYKAMRQILDVILVNDISPEEVSNMILAIFSDMQIDSAGNNDDTMMENITNMYRNAGLMSKYKTPFNPPHILFWNLRSTTGFPTLSSTENTTMLSGYSSTLLNVFVEKGFTELKNITPAQMLEDMLNIDRYSVLEKVVENYYKTV